MGARLLRVLHVSDLHERGNRENELWRRRRVFGPAWERTLDAFLDDGAIDLVCFTGDLADWGQAGEYTRATDFISDVLSHVRVPLERFFPVPGNHDIARRVNTASWRAVRKALLEEDSLAFSRWWALGNAPLPRLTKHRGAVLEREKDYRAWLTEIGRPELLPDHSPHGSLGYRSTFRLRGFPHPIHVIGYDTAWLSGDNHDAGKLALTEDQIVRLAVDDAGNPLTGFRLALMHHPLTDLHDAQTARRLLAEHVDVVLRGHLHDFEPELWADPDRRLLQVVAGCLYEGSLANKHPNTCHVVEFGLDDAGKLASASCHIREWSDRVGWHPTNRLYKDTKNGRVDLWPSSRPQFAKTGRTFKNFRELCKFVYPLLEENRRARFSLGPNSDSDAIGDVKWDLSLWEKAKQELIVPNNKKIEAALTENATLIPKAARALVDRMLSHAFAFEKHCEDPGMDYSDNQFPVEFAELVASEAIPRASRLSSDVATWLKSHLAKPALGIRDAYLFGSHLIKGKGAGDVDLAVVHDKSSPRFSKLITPVCSAFFSEFGLELDITVFSAEEHQSLEAFLRGAGAYKRLQLRRRAHR